MPSTRGRNKEQETMWKWFLMEIVNAIFKYILEEDGIRALRPLALVCKQWHYGVQYHARRHVCIATHESDYAYIMALTDRFTSSRPPTLFPHGPQEVRQVRILVWMHKTSSEIWKPQVEAIYALLAMLTRVDRLEWDLGSSKPSYSLQQQQKLALRFIGDVWGMLPSVRHLTIGGDMVCGMDIEDLVMERLHEYDLKSLVIADMHSLMAQPLVNRIFLGQQHVEKLCVPLLYDDASLETVLDYIAAADICTLRYLELYFNYNPLVDDGYEYFEQTLLRKLRHVVEKNPLLEHFALDSSNSFHMAPLQLWKVLQVLSSLQHLKYLLIIHDGLRYPKKVNTSLTFASVQTLILYGNRKDAGALEGMMKSVKWPNLKNVYTW